jgi:hypothetical protein
MEKELFRWLGGVVRDYYFYEKEYLSDFLAYQEKLIRCYLREIGWSSREINSSFPLRDSLPLPGSVCWYLAYISDELAKCYSWTRESATMFVLTGRSNESPIKSIRCTTNLKRDRSGMSWPSFADYYTISMEIEPWISADTVYRVYRDRQREILRHNNRPLGTRSLALLRFIVKNIDGMKKKPWRNLMMMWNQTHSEYRQDDVANFARDVNRALEAIGIHPIEKRHRKQNPQKRADS